MDTNLKTNLMLEKKKPLPEQVDPSVVRIPCWKQTRCKENRCSAHNKWELPCWRLINKPDKSRRTSKWIDTFESCLLCAVFRSHAESDPQGWNYFVASQMKMIARDVARDASEEEKSHLQVLDNLPDGLFTMDKEGRINYFNPAAERITGISASDAMGIHCSQLFKTTTCRIDAAKKNAVPMEKNLYNRQFSVTTRQGKTLHITSSISVLKDDAGNVTGGVQVFKDTSDRKSLEDSLRLSESKYRRIFEGSKDMIFITSRDGAIKEINQAAVDLMGYGNKEEILAIDSVEALYETPMHWQVFKTQIDRYGFAKDFEACFKRKDGTRMHCLLSGNAVRKQDSEIVGYEGIVKDITARMDAIRNLKRSNRELLLLNAVALVMNATQDLNDILMTALNNVLEVLNLKAGGIFLIEPELSIFSLRVQQGLLQTGDENEQRLILNDQDLMEALLKKDLNLKPKSSFPPFMARLMGRENKMSRQLTCFLITAKEKASGFLSLELPQKKHLTDQDIHLLGSLGNFLGGAIENSRLIRTVHDHREELKELTARLFQSQEEERRRIARELHDEAGQALTGINFTLETIQKSLSPEQDTLNGLISDVKKQLNRTYQELRLLSYKLHPALLSDLGLEPALDSYLTRISKHTELEIHFKMIGFKERLDPDIETMLYRLSQESLINTLKHAKAGHFSLTIIKSYPHIILSAEDDGTGFDVGEITKRRKTLGLLSMRERVSMLGGDFSLRSSIGKGTRIRIKIPISTRNNGI